MLVACIIPFVDALSVWRGPTHSITTQHFAGLRRRLDRVPRARQRAAAYLGPPDILFFALFLAAAPRFGLRVVLDVDRDDRSCTG